MTNQSGIHRTQRALGQYGLSLDSVVRGAERLSELRKSDVAVGDWILVKTCNSVYTIRAVGDNRYLVSGGWFDRNGLSPKTMTIAGCTWGGSIIKIDVAAACGLCLEFGNRLTTSTIQKIIVLQRGAEN